MSPGDWCSAVCSSDLFYRSGTVVTQRPEEQFEPNNPIFSALPLYMAMRSCMVRAVSAGGALTFIRGLRRRRRTIDWAPHQGEGSARHRSAWHARHRAPIDDVSDDPVRPSTA